jgi:TPR repeat protein
MSFSGGVDLGDPEANMGLSKWYLCGADGFPANEEKAFIYAERAAKKGLPQAEFAMGMIFYIGLTLGYFYEVGICVAVDITMAEGWV